MYLGRYQRGQTVGLTLRTTDHQELPAWPDAAPYCRVYGPDGLAAAFRLPVVDRFVLTGAFHLPLLLDGRFAEGRHVAEFLYVVSSLQRSRRSVFEVCRGGHPDGPGLACHYYARPTSDFLLMHTDGGKVSRRRNPRVV